MSGENVAWRWCGQCGSARWEDDGEPPNPNSITEPELPKGLRAGVSSQQDDERTEQLGELLDEFGLAYVRNDGDAAEETRRKIAWPWRR